MWSRPDADVPDQGTPRSGVATLGSMGLVRAVAARLMTTGVLSAGMYSVLTGLALLYVAILLSSVSGDKAAPFVAVTLAVAGVWQLERGLRAEFQRRPQSPDASS